MLHAVSTPKTLTHYNRMYQKHYNYIMGSSIGQMENVKKKMQTIWTFRISYNQLLTDNSHTPKVNSHLGGAPIAKWGISENSSGPFNHQQVKVTARLNPHGGAGVVPASTVLCKHSAHTSCVKQQSQIQSNRCAGNQGGTRRRRYKER